MPPNPAATLLFKTGQVCDYFIAGWTASNLPALCSPMLKPEGGGLYIFNVCRYCLYKERYAPFRFREGLSLRENMIEKNRRGGAVKERESNSSIPCPFLSWYFEEGRQELTAKSIGKLAQGQHGQAVIEGL